MQDRRGFGMLDHKVPPLQTSRENRANHEQDDGQPRQIPSGSHDGRLVCVRAHEQPPLAAAANPMPRAAPRDKEALSEAELDYLTVVDGVDHFAIGALVLDEIGRERVEWASR